MDKEFIDNVYGASNYLMDTYSRLPIVIVKGEGSILYDLNGKSYIDFTSGIGVNSLGYGDEDWIEEVSKQIKNIAHTSNVFYNIPSIELAEKLALMSNMDKVFFANSGAEANEGAIKLARKYSFEKYGDKRSTIITLKQSFHGRTITTLSATGQERLHKFFFPFTEGFRYAEAVSFEEFEKSLEKDVCAVMMEAIRGEGGVLLMNHEFIKKVDSICKEKDILLIFDEVQCGIGRTGRLFGYNNFRIEPDIITLAKGLASGIPIGAVLCNKKLGGVFKKGDHGSTFGGNPVAASAALVVLNKISEEGFLESVNQKGNIIMDYLKNIHNDKIVDVRGKGLMIGVEIKGDSSLVQKKAMEKGLLILTAGPNVVRLLPPLTIGEHEINSGLKILDETISEMDII